jgi:hypothetical protein
MKYHCGHSGCDICGSRECTGAMLRRFNGYKAEYLACEACLIKAVELALMYQRLSQQ